MDRKHLRFFTRKSAQQLLLGAQFTIAEERTTTIHLHLLIKAPAARPLVDSLTKLYGAATSAWPKGLAYQFVFKAQARRPDWKDLQRVPLSLREHEPHPHLCATNSNMHNPASQPTTMSLGA